MKKLALIPLVLLLSACDAGYDNVTDSYLLPPELSDCKVYELDSTDGNHVVAIRCPNSQTETKYRSGKTTHTTTVN